MFQTGIQQQIATGESMYLSYSDIPEVGNGIAIPVEFIAEDATISLPSISFTENKQLASSILVGQTVIIKDSSQKNLSTVKLKKNWLQMTNDDSKSGSYPYTLNSTGIQAIEATLGSTSRNGVTSTYTLKQPNTAIVTIKAKPVQKASVTINYVDQAQHKIISSTKISGNVGDSGAYTVQVPSGYQLATGQSKTLHYQITADKQDDLTVKITKKAKTDNQTASSAGSSKNTSGSSIAPSRPTFSSPEHRHSTVKTMGSATVMIVDDDTGKALYTKMYSGPLHSHLQLNLSKELFKLLRQSYNIAQDETKLATFTQKSSIYRIHLKKHILSFTNAVGTAFETSSKTQKSSAKVKSAKLPKNIEDLTRESVLQTILRKNYRSIKVSYPLTHQSTILDESLTNLLQHHANGGGGGSDLSKINLSAFFKSLSGVVNFGQTPHQ